MKRIKIFLWAVILGSSLFVASCQEKEDFEDSIFDVEDEELSATGQWIYDNYVTPYNIEVLYEWKGQETDLTKNLTPPKEETVVPFLMVMHYVWISAYLDLEGERRNDVFKPLFPKQVQLLGSSGYNTNGTMAQGTAEGGKKLIMYDLDHFVPDNRTIVKDYVRILHHEFGHLLNQFKEYPMTFKQVTPDSYTATWYNTSPDDAIAAGHITPYAMASPDEDFVETLAIYLTNTPEEWAAMLNAQGVSASGRLSINRKLEIVRTYMQENFDVDINELRDSVLTRMDDIHNGEYGIEGLN